MNTSSMDLMVEFRSADGTSSRYYQANESLIREILSVLAAPQLLARPYVLMALGEGTQLIPCRGIDMILVRTSVRTPLKFPLTLPAVRLDMVESSATAQDHSDAADHPNREADPSRPLISWVDIQTLGGWTVSLRIAAIPRGNADDDRRLFANLLNVPVIPFRLKAGGFGLINPGNMSRLSAWPKPDALPETALPMESIRQTTSRFEASAPAVSGRTWSL